MFVYNNTIFGILIIHDVLMYNIHQYIMNYDVPCTNNIL